MVLYEPDLAIWARQLDGLRGIPVFAFANGPLDDRAMGLLSTVEHHLLQSSVNRGLAFGLNALMEAAAERGFEHVLLLDQDSEPTFRMISALAERMTLLQSEGRRVAAVAPLLRPPDNETYLSIRYSWRRPTRNDDLVPADFVPTSGSLIPVASYRAIGAFREDFFIAGIDVEWGFRSWSLGYGSYVAKTETMVHRWGAPLRPNEPSKPQVLRQSALRNYYHVRNLIAVANLRHVPLSWRLHSRLALLVQVALLMLVGPRHSLRAIVLAIRDGARNRLGPAPEGL